MQQQQQARDPDLSLNSVENGDDEHSISSSIGAESKTAAKTTTTTKRQADQLMVWGSRTFVLMVLMLSATILALKAYYLVSEDEWNDFEAEFNASATQIVHMANKNVDNTFKSVKIIADLFPTASHLSGEKLPFVSIDDFEAVAGELRDIAKATMVAYTPLLTTQSELDMWNAYSTNHTKWITYGQNFLGETNTSAADPTRDLIVSGGNNTAEYAQAHQETSPETINYVYEMDDQGDHVEVKGDGVYAPLWQVTPLPPKTDIFNYNLASNRAFQTLLEKVLLVDGEVLSELVDIDYSFGHSMGYTEDKSPTSILMQPIYGGFQSKSRSRIHGTVSAWIRWGNFLEDVLRSGHPPVVVVSQSCERNNTFTINGPSADFIGEGDLHDPKYDSMGIFYQFEFDTANEETEYCHQHLFIFPTAAMEGTFKSRKPQLYAGVVIAMFSFAALVFLLYDWFVTNRQTRTEAKAKKTNDIVAELFPGNVAEQLFTSRTGSVPREDRHQGDKQPETTTIAELYPSATVLFADIAGFTAWSSMRDPNQVFMLLGTIFQSFDVIAKKRGIFKVETIGDCYVAVCGVPKRNEMHAVQMARFATDLMTQFPSVIGSLEMALGPDTSELAMRVGMHSGPVTAGVLQGDRARFQLFGDTVNTASRIESTGSRGKVHLSEQTALELIKHQKEHWIVRRDDIVEAKGKGNLVTYWLKHVSKGDTGAASVVACTVESTTTSSNDAPDVNPVATSATGKSPALAQNKEKVKRLVQWNSELLLHSLKRVVGHREGAYGIRSAAIAASMSKRTGHMFVEEVAEIIEMPTSHAANMVEPSLSDAAATQLHQFIEVIAILYKDNPFHNFEHASHVTMSVKKLLSRITAPELTSQKGLCAISFDPLTEFAIVLAALIHDLDHPGIPNTQLMQHDPALAKRFQNRSVAEQNSLDLAWTELFEPGYKDLRSAIFETEAEIHRFRQVLVNAVMATDIFDPELSALRKKRWDVAFHNDEADDSTASSSDPNRSRQHVNRKATIVIEHLIQASDVAHTMQHWHIYLKWNQRLFDEMCHAYRAGRSERDPVVGWYEGELGFFDNYIIPLAKKLKDCGVFGASSDEYLTYAMANRSEWAEKGRGIVEEYATRWSRMEV